MSRITPRQKLVIEAERKGIEYYTSLPEDIKVQTALAMDYGPYRNLALRRALGLPYPGEAVCLVNKHSVIQVMVDSAKERDRILNKLRVCAIGWGFAAVEMDDGGFMVVGKPGEDDG